MFEDVTLAQMPNVNVRWSWELEFVDVDNDWDLDILVSAYAGDKASLFLFANDGAGTFTDASAGNLTQGRFALDVESIDLTGDGFMDLLTLHDGTSGRNRLLINDKNGKFTDSTDLLWPKLANPARASTSRPASTTTTPNKKVDWVLGALQTAQVKYPDRLIYEKAGKYEQNTMAFQEDPGLRRHLLDRARRLQRRLQARRGDGPERERLREEDPARHRGDPGRHRRADHPQLREARPRSTTPAPRSSASAPTTTSRR
jgi:hypothetical protein